MDNLPEWLQEKLRDYKPYKPSTPTTIEVGQIWSVLSREKDDARCVLILSITDLLEVCLVSNDMYMQTNYDVLLDSGTPFKLVAETDITGFIDETRLRNYIGCVSQKDVKSFRGMCRRGNTDGVSSLKKGTPIYHSNDPRVEFKGNELDFMHSISDDYPERHFGLE